MGDIKTISNLAITDVLVTCTFTADQWQSLSLTAEYYQGTLAFTVDANVAYKIPAIGYTSSGEWSNYLVHVGTAVGGDRSLCACEEW